MDRKGQRAETGIGADVARRLLAADVLLAGRQGQCPAAPSIGIDGLADQPSGHLAHEFLAASRTARHRGRRNSARCRATGPRRRRCRRPSRRAAESRPTTRSRSRRRPAARPPVAEFGQFRVVAHLAVKIRVLHDDAGRVAVDQRREILAAAGRRVLHRRAGCRRTGRKSRTPRGNADAARRTARPCRGASRGRPSRQLRRRRSRRHRARRSPPPCRSAARPASGTRTDIAASPATPRAGTACTRSGTRRAGSGDRPRPGHGGGRRRRRERTAPTRRCRFFAAIAPRRRSTSSSPIARGRSSRP